jgi:hypothetical protein
MCMCNGIISFSIQKGPKTKSTLWKKMTLDVFILLFFPSLCTGVVKENHLVPQK